MRRRRPQRPGQRGSSGRGGPPPLALMFESLSGRLGAVLKRLSGRGVLRPEDVDAVLREVRMALLEADVSYKVVKVFGERVREQLVGTEVAEHLTAAQQAVEVVHDETIALLGSIDRGPLYADRPPTVVLLAALDHYRNTTETALPPLALLL